MFLTLQSCAVLSISVQASRDRTRFLQYKLLKYLSCIKKRLIGYDNEYFAWLHCLPNSSAVLIMTGSSVSVILYINWRIDKQVIIKPIKIITLYWFKINFLVYSVYNSASKNIVLSYAVYFVYWLYSPYIHYFPRACESVLHFDQPTHRSFISFFSHSDFFVYCWVLHYFQVKIFLLWSTF